MKTSKKDFRNKIIKNTLVIFINNKSRFFKNIISKNARRHFHTKREQNTY